jgi:hypothetical protein
MDESFMKPEECRHPNTGLKPVDNSSIVIGVFLCVGLMVRHTHFKPLLSNHERRPSPYHEDFDIRRRETVQTATTAPSADTHKTKSNNDDRSPWLIFVKYMRDICQ